MNEMNKWNEWIIEMNGWDKWMKLGEWMGWMDDTNEFDGSMNEWMRWMYWMHDWDEWMNK